MAATICATPVSARSYLNCVAKKVIIVDSPRGSNLSSTEDNLGFWIDEAAKTIMLADGTPLTVHRFDDHWISLEARVFRNPNQTKTFFVSYRFCQIVRNRLSATAV